MKYLKYFKKQTDYQTFKESNDYILPNVSYVVSEDRVSFNPAPTPISNGVYVQHINRKLYTKDEWVAGGFSNDEANGIAVVDDRASFVVAKTQLGAKKWASDTVLVDGMPACGEVDSLNDYNGYSNTEKIAAVLPDSAASKCRSYTFPNGEIVGYLPAMGELKIIYDYLAEINIAMDLVGGVKIKIDENINYWSSTQWSEYNAWGIKMLDGKVYYCRKTSFYFGYVDYHVLPVGLLNV